MKTRFSFLCAVVVVFFCGGLQVRAENDLAKLRATFEEAVKNSHAEKNDFSDQYGAQLKGIEAKAIKDGDLDLVLAVKAELESYRDSSNPEFSEEAELAKLQRIYRQHLKALETKRLKKIEEAKAEYRAALVTRRADLTKAGKLEEAMEIHREWERVKKLKRGETQLGKLGDVQPSQNNPPAESGKPSRAPGHLVAILTSREWFRKNGRKRDRFIFYPNGELKSPDFGTSWRKFSVDGSTLTITKKNGMTLDFKMTSNSPYVFTGESAEVSKMKFIEIE